MRRSRQYDARSFSVACSLRDALPRLKNGDLALYRGRGLVQWLIQSAGRTEYSHAAMIAWWDEQPMLLETVPGAGGRAITLVSQVEVAPGRWDIYEVNPDHQRPEFEPDGAVAWMRAYCDSRYGLWTLLAAALVHLPIVRLMVPPATDDRSNGSRPFCSSAVAAALRLGGGVDAVPHLADKATEPADLARSPFFRYRFTLLP